MLRVSSGVSSGVDRIHETDSKNMLYDCHSSPSTKQFSIRSFDGNKTIRRKLMAESIDIFSFASTKLYKQWELWCVCVCVWLWIEIRSAQEKWSVKMNLWIGKDAKEEKNMEKMNVDFNWNERFSGDKIHNIYSHFSCTACADSRRIIHFSMPPEWHVLRIPNWKLHSVAVFRMFSFNVALSTMNSLQRRQTSPPPVPCKNSQRKHFWNFNGEIYTINNTEKFPLLVFNIWTQASF